MPTHDTDAIELWQRQLTSLRAAFSAPAWTIFQALMAGWALCPGRKTITAIYRLADPHGIRSHDAYHRFVRCGNWAAAGLWKTLALAVIGSLVPSGTIELDLDDTLLHKTGRKMSGTGWWRDAVRSTGTRVVVALGLNILVVTLRIRPPWGGEPLGLPILVLLHRKGGEKLTALAVQAVATVRGWFTGRRFICCADGAFAAPLIPRGEEGLIVISRLRRDAALYGLRPQRTGKRGRPRVRGKRLGTPVQIAAAARTWKRVVTDERGRPRERLVYSKQVLWHAVSSKPVLLVISRDPAGVEHDDFWVCSDVSMAPVMVVSTYAGRWSIECTFRATKQTLGAHEPQSWAGDGPERAGTLGFLLYTLVWWWFLSLNPAKHVVSGPEWYPAKCRPSFHDALAELRRVLWHKRISRTSGRSSVSNQIIRVLVDALCRAA